MRTAIVAMTPIDDVQVTELWLLVRATRAVTIAQLRDGFDFVPLSMGEKFDRNAARAAAPGIRTSLRGRSAIVLGDIAWGSLGLVHSNRLRHLNYYDDGGVRWWFFPRMSGRQRPATMRDPETRSQMGAILVRHCDWGSATGARGEDSRTPVASHPAEAELDTTNGDRGEPGTNETKLTRGGA